MNQPQKMATVSELNTLIAQYAVACVGRMWTRSMHRRYTELLRARREALKLERSDHIKWILTTSK